jgi:hypothetical protein
LPFRISELAPYFFGAGEALSGRRLKDSATGKESGKERLSNFDAAF